MPYQIKTEITPDTPAECLEVQGIVIYGKSDAKCPPHKVTLEEYYNNKLCKCVLVEAEDI